MILYIIMAMAVARWLEVQFEDKSKGTCGVDEVLRDAL